MAVNADGASTFDACVLNATLATDAIQPLSAAGAGSLAFMREEELAHAVYLAGPTRWPALPVFGHIDASEPSQTSAGKALRNR